MRPSIKGRGAQIRVGIGVFKDGGDGSAVKHTCCSCRDRI